MLSANKKLKLFSELIQSSGSSPALYHVLREINRRLAAALKASIAVVFIYNEEAKALEAQQPSLGLDFKGTSKLRLEIDAPGLITESFRKGEPFLLRRSLSKGLAEEKILPGYDVFDLIGCPLATRGKNIGIMVLANKLTRRGFNRKDLALLEMLAPHISVFLDNAMLYRRNEEKLAQLTSLIRVIDAMNTVSSLDEMYNLALDVVKGLFAAEKALINIIDDSSGQIQTVRSFGYGDEYIRGHLSQPFEKINGCFVLNSNSTYLCRNLSEDRRCPNMIVDKQTSSVLCAPIRSGMKVYGILHMASHYINAFDEEDAVLANAIGEQIGMAVESARLFEEINRMAVTDSLTGLYNIRHLKRVLNEEVRRSIRYSRPLSFIMLDIDFFKIYNDRHGHPRGDEVLRVLADLVGQNTRDVDTVVRYGGEEFSIIIPEVNKQEAYSMAERIRQVIQDHEFPYEKDQPSGRLTVSGGVANLPQDAIDGDELIDKADRALYRAKQTGRNRICMYAPDYDAIALHASDASQSELSHHAVTGLEESREALSEHSERKRG
jgi:diguanylate cyclase (GGDEF)-like protein